MPKFKVQVQQYVEKVAEIEVEAADEYEARSKALDVAAGATWTDGDDAYGVSTYAVMDLDGTLVWER